MEGTCVSEGVCALKGFPLLAFLWPVNTLRAVTSLAALSIVICITRSGVHISTLLTSSYVMLVCADRMNNKIYYHFTRKLQIHQLKALTRLQDMPRLFSC